jgi:hypothetical protein
MSKHKHHIIPRYKCKELGIDPDFPENIVEVTKLDHALIHWGYKCNDLKPLLEVCNPPQYVIDMIPLGDDRDFGAAAILSKDSQTLIVKHGDLVGAKRVGSCDIRNEYRKKKYHADIEKSRAESRKRYHADIEKSRVYQKKMRVKYKQKKKEYDAKRYARKKLERQGIGTLEGFLK